jgi:hypothetical protein
MTPQDEIVETLRRIEANQRRALEAQQQHLELARSQLERSEQRITESVQLQKLAVARQAQALKFALPAIAVLMVLLVWLLVKWRIL